MPDASPGIRKKAKASTPPLFAVVLLDDDKTPMAFVVELIERLFHYSRKDAIRLMMEVHIDGRAVCGRYVEELAYTKAHEAEALARRRGHPLRCIIERDGECLHD